MRLALISLLMMLLAVGCSSAGDKSTGAPWDTGTSRVLYEGYGVVDHFRFDGTRTAWFRNPEKEYLLRVNSDPSSRREVDGTTLHTKTFTNDTTGEQLFAVDWSVSDEGVRIHGYSNAPDERVTYSPPVKITERVVTDGDVVTTVSDHGTVRSAFAGEVSCPNEWAGSDWQCLAFEISSTVPAPFVGTWWQAPSFGASRFKLGESSAWALVDFHWLPEA